MELFDPDAVFVGHEASRTAWQALDILENVLGKKTEPLRDGMKSQKGTVALVSMYLERMPSNYLRIIPGLVDQLRAQDAQLLAIAHRNLWVTPQMRVIIINTRFACGTFQPRSRNGRMGPVTVNHTERFTEALREACTPPAPERIGRASPPVGTRRGVSPYFV